MENDNKKKKKRILEKVIMGAIIGGAIGSVVGASIAPKKGKETREDIVNIAKTAKVKSHGIFKSIIKYLVNKKKNKEQYKEIPHEQK